MHNLKNPGVLPSLYSQTGSYTSMTGICAKVTDPSWLYAALAYLRLPLFYCVPCPGFPDAESAYMSKENKWAGEYGANRRYLLGLLIRLAEGDQTTPRFENEPN